MLFRSGLTKRGVRLPTRRIESDQIGRGPIREGSIESNQIGRRGTVGQQGAGALSEENQEYLEKKKLDSMYDLEIRRRDKEEYDYEQQMQRSKYDYEQYMDRNKFDYQYTSKQKEEVDKLNNLYEMAVIQEFMNQPDIINTSIKDNSSSISFLVLILSIFVTAVSAKTDLIASITTID